MAASSNRLHLLVCSAGSRSGRRRLLRYSPQSAARCRVIVRRAIGSCRDGCGAAYCSDPELGDGGQTVEAAGSCVGGGGGKGLEVALGAGSALAVCVLETDLWPLAWRAGFDTGWSTTRTGG